MAKTKLPIGIDVLTAARQRIVYTLDNFERPFISFSGGKDSSVMFHLVAEEARQRKQKVGVMVQDMEAQYEATVAHVWDMLDAYADCIEPYWVCLPIKLRNAVSNFSPVWQCWDPDAKDVWVRELPKHPAVISDPKYFPFFHRGMEWEEFIPLFGQWYSKGKEAVAFVGIRADESLNRFRTICTFKKETHGGKRYTTKVDDGLWNSYPLYDWRTRDVWIYHSKFQDKQHNRIYDLMHQAGVSPSQQRLCQPFGDDQRRGLWLYHILEPQTWYKLIARVNGVNSGSLYINENGNVTGYNKIYKPEGHTWKSFCHLLLKTMPKVTRDHFITRFKVFIKGWQGRGYVNGIPDEAPLVLENAQWAPSYRRLCKVLLRNDWWCKGLGLVQPKSEAYQRYMETIKAAKKKGGNIGDDPAFQTSLFDGVG